MTTPFQEAAARAAASIADVMGVPIRIIPQVEGDFTTVPDPDRSPVETRALRSMGSGIENGSARKSGASVPHSGAIAGTEYEIGPDDAAELPWRPRDADAIEADGLRLTLTAVLPSNVGGLRLLTDGRRA